MNRFSNKKKPHAVKIEKVEFKITVERAERNTEGTNTCVLCPSDINSNYVISQTRFSFLFLHCLLMQISYPLQ